VFDLRRQSARASLVQISDAAPPLKVGEANSAGQLWRAFIGRTSIQGLTIAGCDTRSTPRFPQ
jgi:hypothetical protein